jgi:hypothetical protein
MTSTRVNLFMDVSQPPPYFIGLVKSDQHSGDRCIAPSFAVGEGKQAQGASRKLHGIGLPSARSHS